MNNSSKLNSSRNKQAFEGLAKTYDKIRPSYPVELFSSIISYWRLKNSIQNDKLIITDIGCGTGISTRAFYNALEGKCKMIGIEPGKDMLKTAIDSSPKEINFIEGSAESIPLENQSVNIVTAAQAAQWFDRPKFYNDVNRILKEKGVIAVYENNRDWEKSDFLTKHEEFLEKYSLDKTSGKEYSRDYRNFSYENELSIDFNNVKTFSFSWKRQLTPEEFLQLAKSSTQVKKAFDNIGEKEASKLILENANNYLNKDGQVEVHYITKLYMARKN